MQTDIHITIQTPPEPPTLRTQIGTDIRIICLTDGKICVSHQFDDVIHMCDLRENRIYWLANLLELKPEEISFLNGHLVEKTHG